MVNIRGPACKGTHRQRQFGIRSSADFQRVMEVLIRVNLSKNR